VTLSNKQRVFISEYLRDFNATQAAIRAGYSSKTAYSIGQENLKKPEILEAIKTRVDEIAMGTDEILVELTKQARGDIGVFFKVVEEWTYYPLPTHEVIDAKEVDITDEEGKSTGEKKISYWVRHIAVDLDKVVDPRYSHLLAQFSDSPKDGISFKPYSKQVALQTLAKIRGMLVEKHEHTGKDGGAIVLTWKEFVEQARKDKPE
jgi:phage terminase small subunit